MKEERRMILKMIEEGKITAEEGIALLEALERSMSAEEKMGMDGEAGKASGPSHAWSGSGKWEKARKRDEFDFEEIKREIVAKAEKIRKEFASQGRTMTHRLSDLVEKIIARVKDIDFDFDLPFGTGVKVEKVFSGMPPASGLIELVAINGDIDIQGWDKPVYRVKVKAWVKADNETEGKAVLNEIIRVEEDQDRLSLYLDHRKGTKVALEVFLPWNLAAGLRVVTSNGTIAMEEYRFEEATLETYNGHIRVEESKGNHLHCVTSNGKVELEDCEMDELYAKTSNGILRVDGVVKKATCRTSNGGIRYYLREATEGNLDLLSTNGSIDVRLPVSGLKLTGEMSTTFGSLDCTLPDVEITSSTTETPNKSLRFQSVRESGKSFTITCKTSNGSVRVLPLEG